jgi:uncharacterized protein YegP (UPF0339 family)
MSSAVNEFDRPRLGAGGFPSEISAALLRIGRPKGAASAAAAAVEEAACPNPDAAPYFEIYRAERISLTTILFSGGDWRWRFCAASGTPIAVSSGYGSERACLAAVAALRGGAGAAMVRGATRGTGD